MNVRSTPRPIAKYALAALAFLLLNFSFLSVPAIAQSVNNRDKDQKVLVAQAGTDNVDNTDDDNTFSVEDEDVSFGRCTVSTKGGIAQGLAFIICPIVEMILDSIDWAENNIVVPYLSVNPMIAKDGEPLYELWKIVRNIANVGLIIGFMFLVFSHTTSFGGDAYAVKKMAPRLILVTIGIQLSFYIAAFVVDIFNILGAGVGQLTAGIIQQYGSGTTVNISMADYSDAGMSALLGLGAAGLIRGIARGSIGLSPIAGFFVAAFITIIAVVLTLVLRQLVIASLVVVAPVAFAAALLPNTEKVFETWKSWFTKSLMMYPLIIGLFAMGKLFSIITAGFNPSGAQADGITGIVSFIANIVPLVVIPFTFRLAGGVIAGAMNFANTRAKNMQHATTNRQSAFMRKWNELDDYRFKSYMGEEGQDADAWKPKRAWSAKLLARSGKMGEKYGNYRSRKAAPMFGLTRAGRHAAIMRYADAVKEKRDMFHAAFTTPHSYEASAHFLNHWYKGEKEVGRQAQLMMNDADPWKQQIGRNLWAMRAGANDAYFVEAAAMHATSGSKTGSVGETTKFLNEAAKGFMTQQKDGTWRFNNADAFRQYDRLLQAVSKSGGRGMMHMGKIGAFQGQSWDTPIDFDTQNAFSWGGNTKGLHELPDQDRRTNYGILDAFGDVERYGMGQLNNNGAAGLLRAISEDVETGKFRQSFFPDKNYAQRANDTVNAWGSIMSQSMNDKAKRKVLENLNYIYTGNINGNSDSAIAKRVDMGPSAIRFLQTRDPATGQMLAQKLFNMLSSGAGRALTEDELANLDAMYNPPDPPH